MHPSPFQHKKEIIYNINPHLYLHLYHSKIISWILLQKLCLLLLPKFDIITILLLTPGLIPPPLHKLSHNLEWPAKNVTYSMLAHYHPLKCLCYSPVSVRMRCTTRLAEKRLKVNFSSDVRCKCSNENFAQIRI